MAQPVKLYICYAPTDETALSYLEKCLRPWEIPGKIQLWHKGKISPGENHEQQIVTQLDQAQAIIILVSADLFAHEYYESIEMRHVLQRHHESKVHVIPVIVKAYNWQETFLGKLEPLPKGGRPASQDDGVWTKVGAAIGKIARDIQEQAKQELAASASPAISSGKASKSARKAEPLAGAALTIKKSKATRPRPSTRRDTPSQPETPDQQLTSTTEPEPTTDQAKTSTSAYDQNYEKLQHEINQIVFDILVWEPAQPFQELVVASERHAIYQSLQAEQHKCWLGTQLQAPPGVSLQDREIQQAYDADMTILVVEISALGEMYAFCSDYNEDLFSKMFCFYPDLIKSRPGSEGLDAELHKGYKLEYYTNDQLTHYRLRAEVLEWVGMRRRCRYRKQRRSGR